VSDHPLGFLIGVWSGEGRGEFPTISPFTYGEEVEFAPVAGKPVLRYAQRTWNLQTHAPMHGESGFWRPVGDDGVEVVLAHPTGIVEIEEGQVAGTTVTLDSKVVAGTSTAVDVKQLARTFVVDGDVMRYTVDMAAAGQPLSPHLFAELRRG